MPPVDANHRNVRRLLDSASPCLTDDGRRDDLQPLFIRDNHRADYLHLYPGLDPVCASHGFGWDRTLAEWSLFPEWMLLTLARAARIPPAPPAAPVVETIAVRVDDLNARHRPLDSEIRRLGILVHRLTSSHALPGMRQVAYLLDSLRHALQLHLLHDEMTVFPLSLAHRRTGPPRAEFTAALQFMADGHRDIALQTDRLAAQLVLVGASCPDPDLALVGAGVAALAQGFTINAEAEDALMPLAGLRLDAGVVVPAP